MTDTSHQFLLLNRDSPAIDNSGAKPTSTIVPKGAVICATGLRHPKVPKMIEVEWQGCRLFMFEIDLRERGEQMTEPLRMSAASA
jgi:hypothetical protein